MFCLVWLIEIVSAFIVVHWMRCAPFLFPLSPYVWLRLVLCCLRVSVMWVNFHSSVSSISSIGIGTHLFWYTTYTIHRMYTVYGDNAWHSKFYKLQRIFYDLLVRSLLTATRVSFVLDIEHVYAVEQAIHHRILEHFDLFIVLSHFINQKMTKSMSTQCVLRTYIHTCRATVCRSLFYFVAGNTLHFTHYFCSFFLRLWTWTFIRFEWSGRKSRAHCTPHFTFNRLSPYHWIECMCEWEPNIVKIRLQSVVVQRSMKMVVLHLILIRILFFFLSVGFCFFFGLLVRSAVCQLSQEMREKKNKRKENT